MFSYLTTDIIRVLRCTFQRQIQGFMYLLIVRQGAMHTTSRSAVRSCILPKNNQLRCRMHVDLQQTTALHASIAAEAVQIQAATPPSTRRAWHITQQGDMQSLRLVEEPMPRLNAGEVLVEVRALGLNFADVFCCLGLYKAAPRGDFIPGLEFSGVVMQVAANMTTGDNTDSTSPLSSSQQQQQQQQYKLGDPVLGVLRFGAFASHVIVPAQYLRRIQQTPRPWSFEEAAAYPVQTLTAAFGLYNCGGYKPGQTVLVQSAAGGVGLQALQILHRTQATVLGLVGSDDKVQVLSMMYSCPADSTAGGEQRSTNSTLKAGEQQTVAVHSPQQQQQCSHMYFATRAKSAPAARAQIQDFLQHNHRAGFDVIFDSLGPGPYFYTSYDALNPCGRHVIFGAGSLTPRPGTKLTLSPAALLAAPASLWGLVQLVRGWLMRPKLDVINMPGDNKGVVGFNLIWLYDRLDMLAELYDRVDALGLDPPVVGKVYNFDQLPAALAYLQSGCSIGKVIIAVSKQVEPQLCGKACHCMQ